MPVRNEGINLRIMLKILRAVVDSAHEVLVVYDQEGDDSLSVVEAMMSMYPTLRPVRNAMGRGVLNALKVGVTESRGKYVLIFAADEVGPVLAIDDMLSLMEQGCDFVSCTRYAHGGRRLGGSWIGAILSKAANKWFCRLSGLGLTDATTGIKMFRRELFAALDLQARPIGWAVTFEMAIKAQLMGLALGEVPIVSIDRLYGGKSTFALGPWVSEYFRWFMWGMKQSRIQPRTNRKPAQVRIPATTTMGGKVSM
jgi:dolichol-phosphate mannosyltransferase